MAEILPFRALHYNPEKFPDLSAVVTQPYDKITAEMQARYYDLSPYNLVRIIRGRPSPQDSPKNNVYARAARHFHEWIETHILISEMEPALYPYIQEYCVPGKPGQKQRRGFIGLCRLEDYPAGVVHRHEETLSGPKADRFELLKAVRAHFGQIFVLYSDPTGTVESALGAHAKSRPWQRVHDEYANLHALWRVTDPFVLEQVVEAMREKKLVIADGHHRYETALAYGDYCRTQGKDDERAEYVMMTFIRLETDGLTILPTHRVVHSLDDFKWSGFAGEAQRFFELEELRLKGSAQHWEPRLLEKLGLAGRDAPTLGAYARPDRLALLRLRKDINLESALPDVPTRLRRLDVILLHRIILESVLGIDRQAVREEKNLHYVRELDMALQQVESGKAQICFLMNPTPIEAVWENALAGQALPQKSTDFYPKLLSGLTTYWLDNPAGM